MQKYRSFYPTLRQAKTKWSKPSIVAKQGEGPSHDWYDMMKKDARAKLASSIHHSKMGSISHQTKIVHEAKDKIGKSTPSAETIAKKHGLTLDQINAQIKKGIEVEKEHTNDEAEAHEIARDHLDEFPDYYDRLGAMEKAAKKEQVKEAKKTPLKGFKMMQNDPPVPAPKTPNPTPKGFKRVKDGKFNVLKKVEEGYDQDKELIKNRIETHRNLAQKYAEKNGESSMEAAFHRALVKRMEKELDEDHLNEDAAMSVGAGVIAGMPTRDSADTSIARPLGAMQRRKRFAGKQVFVVDPTTYHKAYLGKRKYEHYEKYLEDCDIADEIRAYGRKYWDEPIIIENEQTGAMVYLKYGSK